MFQYPSLDADRKEIRLLEFHEDFPSHGCDKPLSCSMMVLSLDDLDRPLYSAISYTWGDSSVRRDILVNGQPFQVPKNAEVTLRHLHSKVSGDKPIRLWIDSVCINQASNAERSQQVAIMGDIYFNAHEVFIWLGPDDGTAAEAVRSIGLIMAQCRAETDDLTRLRETLYNKTSSGGCITRYDDSLGSNLPQDLDWAALKSLFSCDWFSRLWTVQEAALGRQSTCFRGAYLLDWMDILVSSRWLAYKKYWEIDASEGLLMSGTWLMFTLRSPPLGCKQPGHAGWCHVGSCHDGWGIHYLLNRVRFFSSSEPRDKLYGIRSLMSEPHASKLRPDYDMEVAKIFAQAAKISIRSFRSTDSLQLSSIQGGVDLEWYEREKWPTWLPCWHLSKLPQLDPHVPLGIAFDVNAADGIRAASAPEELLWWSLRLCGVEIGEVQYVSAIIPNREEGWSRGDIQQVLQGTWDHALKSVASLLRPVMVAIEAFVMSLCIGSVGSPFPADPYPFAILGSPEPEEPRDLLLKVGDVAYIRLPDTTVTACVTYAANRRIFVTSNGYIGLCTRHTQPGDVACIFGGGDLPFVLRSHSDHWLMMGECYIHGVMRGEFIQALRRSKQLEQCWRSFDIR